jgi:hypothetical protein
MSTTDGDALVMLRAAVPPVRIDPGEVGTRGDRSTVVSDRWTEP